MVLGTSGLGIAIWMQALKSSGDIVYMSRNFYGVLTIYEREAQSPKDHHFLLRHGRITHGIQFVDPAQALWPTAYYGEESGVGLAMEALPSKGARLGLVGLGVGTLTAYSRPDDVVRIYEINPEVEKVARTRFTYLNRCACRVEVVPGDARLSLEREPSQQFDLLAVDAFNSDSIPVHLLTREAFEVYTRHLKTNGVLALHISNHYLDLEPVVSALAQSFQFQSARIEYDEMPDQWWLYPSTWVLLTRDPSLLSSPGLAMAAAPPSTNALSVPLWTDDYASLFRILKTK
jgi:spermidine synthase